MNRDKIIMFIGIPILLVLLTVNIVFVYQYLTIKPKTAQVVATPQMILTPIPTPTPENVFSQSTNNPFNNQNYTNPFVTPTGEATAYQNPF